MHQVALGGIEKQEDLKGMDNELFAAAPPEAMRCLLQYLRSRYGGVREYMQAIGFTFEQQEALRKRLTGDWA